MSSSIVKDIYPSLIGIAESTGRVNTENNLSLLAKAYGDPHIMNEESVRITGGQMVFSNTQVVISGRIITLDGLHSIEEGKSVYIYLEFDNNGHVNVKTGPTGEVEGVTITNDESEVSGLNSDQYLEISITEENGELVIEEESFVGGGIFWGTF